MRNEGDFYFFSLGCMELLFKMKETMAIIDQPNSTQ